MSEHSFTPAWWLPGPHLQTVWGKWVRRTRLPHVRTTRLQTDDGDELTIIALPAKSPTLPRVLFLHGLEGTADSHYVRGFFSEAAARGWGVDLLLFRTCDGRLNRAPRTYHSGEISDPAFVLRQLFATAGNSPLALVGVSLGANVMLRLLATLSDTESHRLTAAVAISTPFDLARSCAHLQQGASRAYQWHFVRKLRKKALSKTAQFPGIASADAVAKARTFFEFDDAFTSVVHGFRDANDYYERCSSISILRDIRVPTLLLSAKDDPFHPPELLDDVAELAR
ncbi:MAG: alpha/beta fold hydrolase, partial [Gemmatimonadota bacterium]